MTRQDRPGHQEDWQTVCAQVSLCVTWPGKQITTGTSSSTTSPPAHFSAWFVLSLCTESDLLFWSDAADTGAADANADANDTAWRGGILRRLMTSLLLCDDDGSDGDGQSCLSQRQHFHTVLTSSSTYQQQYVPAVVRTSSSTYQQ